MAYNIFIKEELRGLEKSHIRLSKRLQSLNTQVSTILPVEYKISQRTEDFVVDHPHQGNLATNIIRVIILIPV